MTATAHRPGRREDAGVFRGGRAPLDEPYSLEVYEGLVVRLLDRGYRFESFTLRACEAPTVFLRHDIDYSLGCALKIAEINARRGVAGTFFIRLGSHLYNPAAPASRRDLALLRERYGQRIGLHFSVDGGALAFAELARRLEADFAQLRALAGACEPVFSWHNPASTFEQGEAVMQAEFEGYVNAYAAFAGADHPYFADSNMRYSPAELRDIIDRRLLALQLNFHPFQWCFAKRTMLEVLIATMVQKIRDAEPEFAGNFVVQDLLEGRFDEAELAAAEAALSAAVSARSRSSSP